MICIIHQSFHFNNSIKMKIIIGILLTRGFSKMNTKYKFNYLFNSNDKLYDCLTMDTSNWFFNMLFVTYET